MNCKNLVVTNIQRMCFQDGPGIRTTVFTKGCSIHCPWCSNPENISFSPEVYEKDSIQGIYGREYTAAELEYILLKDKDFWGEDGGVTFSGGEALMQVDALMDILIRLKELHVHVALETALFVPGENLQRVLPYIDYVITDLKSLERHVCREVLGGDLTTYLDNIQKLYLSGKLRMIRIPCCKEYTFTEDNKQLMTEFLCRYQDVPVQVFAIHELGEKKYQSLGKTMWKAKELGRQNLEDYCEELRRHDIKAEVIQI